MDQLTRSWNAAAEYPRNVIDHDNYEHNLYAKFERLNERESQLFSRDGEGALDFWEFDDQRQEFTNTCISNADDLRDQLRVARLPRIKDPRCRFVFVHAAHSRERLKTSRKMLMLTFTYHQVMPAFLDFLFPFGRQQYAQDFHFSGFRHCNQLAESDRGLSIPELGWSGRHLQLCYSLKSVEPSRGQRDWPWSIRQTAVHHSFDVEDGRATWIVVKGDQLMKNRMLLATGPQGPSELSSFQSNQQAFASTLAMHLIICDWSGENWRWYINFLEESFQTTTRRTLSVMVDKLPVQPTPAVAPTPPEVPPGPEKQFDTDTRPDFSFSDLQRLQFIEEKANETLLVLTVNTNILSELGQHYRAITDLEDWPQDLRLDCREDIVRFEKRVKSVKDDLQMQQSRLQTLLRLLADRKSLLYGILEYRNMEASKLLARKAQLSADNMETMTQDMQSMTRDMHEIARKTKQETVSMRIITLVTLFFLPGTFISTLMSTDIVQFQTASSGISTKTVQLGALHLFIAISLPLMFITFSAWYLVYWWVDRTEKKITSLC